MDVARKDAEASGFVVLRGESRRRLSVRFWRKVRETKPGFRVAAVLPSGDFGGILRPGGEGSGEYGVVGCGSF